MFSGFWNSGTHLMPFSVSLLSLPFNGPFRKSLLPYSSPVNLNTTKPTVLGGLASGMAAGSELQPCRNLPESLLWRLWRCLYGRQTSFWHTSSLSFWRHQHWSRSSIASTQQCSVSCSRLLHLSPPHLYRLVWLRPSKQIRPPLFSTKQKRQRRWIVSKQTPWRSPLWQDSRLWSTQSSILSWFLFWQLLLSCVRPLHFHPGPN